MRRDIQNILDKVIHRIVHRFDPQRIILFGSYAIGEPNANSDLDLLIVMNVEGSTRQTAIEIDMLASDRRIPMDFLVLTPEQYERQKNIIGTVGRQAAREGKVVYEQAA
jgi:predicted nucleotidyltransferase